MDLSSEWIQHRAARRPWCIPPLTRRREVQRAYLTSLAAFTWNVWPTFDWKHHAITLRRLPPSQPQHVPANTPYSVAQSSVPNLYKRHRSP